MNFVSNVKGVIKEPVHFLLDQSVLQINVELFVMLLVKPYSKFTFYYVSIIDRECNRNARLIKEAIRIRKATSAMNRDEGWYRLSHV